MSTQSASKKGTGIQVCVSQLSAQLGRWQGPGLFWERFVFSCDKAADSDAGVTTAG